MRVETLPLLTPPLLAVQLRRRGQWRRISPRPPFLVLGVDPWFIRFPHVCPTPLDLCLLEVRVVGFGAWEGMGVGMEVVGFHVPMSGTPVPLPVRASSLLEVEWGIPCPGCAPSRGEGSGRTPPEVQFSPGVPSYGGWCVVSGSKFWPEVPCRGKKRAGLYRFSSNPCA